jgi:hypothetical protein
MEWTEAAAYIAGALVLVYIVYWVVFVDHESKIPLPGHGQSHANRMDRYGRVVDKAKELVANDTEGEWVEIGGWIEHADGTRQPLTPEARAEFMEKWDAETKGTNDDD